MAIEFNCPYCSANIRVPDSAGGGKGKCPRCARRITVPKVSMKSAPRPPAPELELLLPSEPDAPEVPDSPDDVVFAAAEPEDAAPVDFTAVDLLAPRPLGALPVETTRRPLPAGSISSRLKKKKGSSGWLIPLTFGLLLCGGAGWYVWQQQQTEQLKGTVSAETADVLDLPPVELDRDLFRQSPDEMKSVLEALEKSPVRIPSTLMLVQIGANKRAMTFRVNSGPQTRFYRVDFRDDPGLIKYRKDHTLELEQLRSEEVERAASDFVKVYQTVLAKQAEQNALSEFRNTLAIPAMVRGLGHQLVAVYGQTVYRCAYEDRDGAVYFLLPPEAEGFEIIGRKQPDGTVLFPGKYQVKVKGEMKVPAPAGDTKPADKPESETDVPETKPDQDEKKMDKTEDKLNPAE